MKVEEGGLLDTKIISYSYIIIQYSYSLHFYLPSYIYNVSLDIVANQRERRIDESANKALPLVFSSDDILKDTRHFSSFIFLLLACATSMHAVDSYCLLRYKLWYWIED